MRTAATEAAVKRGKADRSRMMSDAQPVFDQLNLVVRDMDAAMTFYRRLGLRIPDAAIWRTAVGPITPRP